MMVRVTGTYNDKAIRSLVVPAVRFYAETLLGKRLAKNIHVNVRLKKDLTVKEGLVGSCIYLDRTYSPRAFDIQLDSSVPPKILLETLAHEMVHVKQYARNEMRDCGRSNKFFWMGEEMSWEDMEYYDHPWEIEAHGRERGLFTRFIMWMGIQGEKWTFDY